jgi:cytochrome c peroxidase
MHTPEEVGIDDFEANRSPPKMYRTSPLKGLFTHEQGGFYHDGRFSTLQAVVDHYDNLLHIGLSEQEKSDLITYLKTL